MIKVLIVDDDKLARRGLVSLMDWEAYGMVVAGDVQNGKTALQFVREHPVDLVFVDIDMPEMNGIEFMEECRKIKPEVQFVVLSFFENFSYVQATLRLGGLDYISKTSMELDNGDAILQRILEKYEQRNNKAVPPKEMGEELAAIWEVCRTQHWFFSDGAFERLKELISQVEPKASNVRRLEMMIARYIGELEGMLELPEIMAFVLPVKSIRKHGRPVSGERRGEDFEGRHLHEGASGGGSLHQHRGGIHRLQQELFLHHLQEAFGTFLRGLSAAGADRAGQGAAAEQFGFRDGDRLFLRVQ